MVVVVMAVHAVRGSLGGGWPRGPVQCRNIGAFLRATGALRRAADRGLADGSMAPPATVAARGWTG